MTTPAEAVATANDLFGVHPGQRALHAKGVLLAGSFAATPAAKELTLATHMQGDPVRVTVRFSNGAGDPAAPDYARQPRGMATKFYLPDGTTTDIVAVDSPVFPARTPEEFVAFLRASKPIGNTEIPGPAMFVWLARHRHALPAIRAGLQLGQPASLADWRYHSLHAFRFIDAGGGERFVRYRWQPEAGVRKTLASEAKRLGRDYLFDELAQRIARGPLRFTLELILAPPGVPTDDPTRVWSGAEEVVAGTLELTGPDETRERDGDVLVFDPTRVTDGIELSGDPVLRFRSDAYAVSVDLRSGATRA